MAVHIKLIRSAGFVILQIRPSETNCFVITERVLLPELQECSLKLYTLLLFVFFILFLVVS